MELWLRLGCRRGIEKRKIFLDDQDRADFLSRLADLTKDQRILPHKKDLSSLDLGPRGRSLVILKTWEKTNEGVQAVQ